MLKDVRLEKELSIGYDAKRILHNFTGLGNYSRFVVSNMKYLYPTCKYYLFASRLNYSSKLEDEFKDDALYVTNRANKKFWRSWKIRKDIELQNLDIYHGLSNELPYQINKGKVKSVVTIHDLIFRKHPECYSLIDRSIYDLKAKYACNIADKIVAVSECTKRDIVEEYKINPDRIEVVYQGCARQFKEKVTQDTKDRVRAKYNLPKYYLLSVGSIEERKNIKLVVEAMRLLDTDIYFYAVGKQTQYSKDVLRLAKKWGLERQVHFLHNVSYLDLPAIMQMATIFIYPSFYEGFGIPIIEAIYSNIPVVAATGSCLEEAGGDHCIYINPTAPTQLAQEINQLLDDTSKRVSMVRGALEYVERFSEENCTNQMMKMYQRLF